MLSTGSKNLDLIFGGGFPPSQIVEFFGKHSTGKTSIAMKIASCFDSVAYIDLENSVNLNYMKTNNINQEDFYLIKKINGVNIFPLIDTMLSTSGIDLIILDSLAAVSPKYIERGLNQIENSLFHSDTTLLVLNQIRSTIGTRNYHSYGPDSFKKRCSLRVKLTKESNIRKNGITTGGNIKFDVVKNRLAPPHKDVIIKLDYGRGFVL